MSEPLTPRTRALGAVLGVVAAVALSCRSVESGSPQQISPSGDAGSTAHDVPGKSRKTMETHQEIVAALAGITDEALLVSPTGEVVNKGYRALDRVRFEGLALRAPALVDMQQHAAVPLLFVVEQGAERPRQVPLPQNAFFLVTRVGPGDRWMTPAFPPPEGKIPMPPGSRPPPPPEPEDPTTHFKSIDRRNLRATGAVPWEPGRYAVRVIAWEVFYSSGPGTRTKQGSRS